MVDAGPAHRLLADNTTRISRKIGRIYILRFFTSIASLDVMLRGIINYRRRAGPAYVYPHVTNAPRPTVFFQRDRPRIINSARIFAKRNNTRENTVGTEASVRSKKTGGTCIIK